MTDQITIPRALLEQAMNMIPTATEKNIALKRALRAELAKPSTAHAQHDAPEVAALKAERDAAMKDAERMKEGLDAVEVLIDNSSGVAGLHLNGDLALWSDLRTGGHFEAWLLAFDEAIDAAMKGTP